MNTSYKFINGKKYLKSGEAARRLGVSKVTLLDWIKKGQISHLKYGSIAYITPEWINQFIEEAQKICVFREGRK